MNISSTNRSAPPAPSATNSENKQDLKNKSDQELVQMLGDKNLSPEMKQAVMDELKTRLDKSNKGGEGGVQGGEGCGKAGGAGGGAEGAGGGDDELEELLKKLMSGNISAEDLEKLKKKLAEAGMKPEEIDAALKDAGKGADGQNGAPPPEGPEDIR